ncbi:transcriptional regulator [Sporanaerobium hydrogeniformans]|uniref:Transcriptional regulator n=1 Tax=Sporanaerobium hydrogeniformans TaxID=3072179 RepID=A0AC61D9D1_9FIRM|nr:MarR family transcriptional regulator [Sporanaerobium hydrogeniformans]PHV69323.1 transcriptional regulator [Sporanaerobium hydrogeniformans]
MANRLLKHMTGAIEPIHFIFGTLQILANRIQVVADRHKAEVSLKQFLLLMIIIQFREDYPTLSELAEEMGTSRQNIKQLALKLQAKELITIEKDERDTRAVRLKPSPGATEIFKEEKAYQDLFIERLYEGLSEEEIKCLAKGLYKMLVNISHMDDLK